MITFDLDETDERAVIVRPRGRLNMAAAPELSSLVIDVVGKGRSRVVVDLSGTEFIDSSGLGALVASLKRCRQAGGDLRLASPTQQVSVALELTNLDRVLRPSDSVDEACARV